MLAAAGLFASPTEDSARQAHRSAALTELHTHVGVLPVDAPCRLSPDRARPTSLRESKGTTRRPGIGNLPDCRLWGCASIWASALIWG